MPSLPHPSPSLDSATTQAIQSNVSAALLEDVGEGDLTALLVDSDRRATATVSARQTAVVCGRPWFDEVFKQLDASIQVQWHVSEGQRVEAGSTWVELSGRARALLTGERTALNFLQLLSAVATQTDQYVQAVSGTRARVVDTRKTIPGLRQAQKYAVRVGGGLNHRMGLYDGILIKENHIASGGGITATLKRAQTIANRAQFVMIEVETLEQFAEALAAGATLVLLDNMTPEQIVRAVEMNQGRAQLEVSGGVNLQTVQALAKAGIDRISIGALTKHISAIDLSMRIKEV
ncbi:MAG TPA: carboxylating nicotinate-nucleotide diphosphorylase [Burkholderiaceae bacterium]|nr:carboxylating nicotinate-nucleotide diphosphorylase [Burkholderiaceae bacterium]